MNTSARVLLAVVSLAVSGFAAALPETQRHYLSGQGPKDAVPWEFFCTDGRRSGEWTTIPVPSQWEQQGFGGYDYGQGSAKRAEERGRYRHKFSVPAEWTGRRVRLVFEGVMTDADVKVNGKPAGPTHVGGFYRFRHDITDLVRRDAENLLEVDVAKVSATPDTERAERHADYWIFGGIHRPVYLEAVPAQSIDQVAIDARADGAIAVDVELARVTDADRVEAQVLTLEDQPAGPAFSASIAGGGVPRLILNGRVAAARPWTAETPHLYRLRTTLLRGAEKLHVVTTRFGFRTFEVRAGEGLFLNGRRIVLKGVNRHSFRPDTGRALDREDCYADVRLIQEMNMNAVRMSHYPPDVAFLEACDELGLYVLDELSGWQHAHDTETGRRLVREMVTRDVNHPSILFWDNGNEGGWNRAVDVEFARYDPQRRPVLHPQDTFSGIDTSHYKSYADMARRARGPHLVMPTEFLHALFDGGGGAGLADYWPLLSEPPFGAGGFLWVLADEGIVRTDQGGRIDPWSTYGPDGLVGPRHEKEGSFHTVREIFSPVQIDAPVLGLAFDGTLTIHNRYNFTALDRCRFVWRTLRFADPAAGADATRTLQEGVAGSPEIAPGASGKLRLPLPAGWAEADALNVAVFDAGGREVWSWSWPTPTLTARLAGRRAARPAPAAAIRRQEGDTVTLSAADVVAQFDAATGLLRSVRRAGVLLPLGNGPRLAWARPAAADQTLTWTRLEGAAGGDTWQAALTAPREANLLELKFEPGAAWYGAKIEVASGGRWRTVFDGTRRFNDGDRYAFSPQAITAVRISNLHRSDGRPAVLRSVRAGHAAARFPAGDEAVRITTGTGEAGAAWLEARGRQHRFRWSLRPDGSLQLDYGYEVTGALSYRGVTFDLPDEQVRGFRWLGQGPYRVWKNRLPGTWLGVHELKRSAIDARWAYPETAGYFAGVRAMRIATAAGGLELASEQPGAFVRVGTPPTDHPNTSADFPPGDLSVLDAIPAIGSKFRTPAETGPASAPADGPAAYSNQLVFRFGP